MESIGVGDTFTQEWHDRFYSILSAYNAATGLLHAAQNELSDASEVNKAIQAFFIYYGENKPWPDYPGPVVAQALIDLIDSLREVNPKDHKEKT